jgi:hypothetical protein
MGPQGIQGVPGIPGGVSGREVIIANVVQTLGKGAFGGARAVCPAGKVVVGGGYQTNNSNFVMTAMLPTGSDTWEVVARNTGNNQSGTIGALAICANQQQ